MQWLPPYSTKEGVHNWIEPASRSSEPAAGLTDGERLNRDYASALSSEDRRVTVNAGEQPFAAAVVYFSLAKSTDRRMVPALSRARGHHKLSSSTQATSERIQSTIVSRLLYRLKLYTKDVVV